MILINTFQIKLMKIKTKTHRFETDLNEFSCQIIPYHALFIPILEFFSQNEMFARKLTRVKDSPVILSYFLRRYLTMYIAISILKKLCLQINNSDF